MTVDRLKAAEPPCRIGSIGAESQPRWVAPVLLAVIVLGYLLVMLAYLKPRNTVANLDYWYHIDLGRSINLADPLTLADGFYPVGYPYLLRLAVQNRIDVLRFGQALSLAGGLLVLGSLFGLGYTITRRPILAAGGAALLVLNLNFVTFAGTEGNDMLAAGLQMLAFWLIWLMVSRDRERSMPWLAVATGVTIGLAYLVRYTSLVLFPVALLFIAWRTRKPARRCFVMLALLLLAFALATLVQTLPTALVYGTPFHNDQAKNVWFGIYGQGDWVNNWGRVPDSISLWQVIALDPQRFLAHWSGQIWQLFAGAMLWPPVLQGIWLVGCMILLIDRRMPPANRLLLVFGLLVPAVATAMAWLGPRFLLMTLAMQALLIVLALDYAASLIPRTALLPASLALVLALTMSNRSQLAGLVMWFTSPADNHAVSVNAFLRSVGMTDPAQVATNDPFLHATDMAARTRYAQVYSVLSQPQSVTELLSQPAAANWRYLVLNYDAGFGDYAVFQMPDVPGRDRIVPLHADGGTLIYCIQPCDARAIQATAGTEVP